MAQIKELRDVLKARYATVESKWISLSEEVDDPFKDKEEHDKCRGDYEKASDTLKKHLQAAKNALNRARDAGTAAPESGSGTSQPQQDFTRPTKMDDMLKPKRKLEDKMTYEQSLQWFIEFRRNITLESNKRFLEAQTPSVRRGIS